MEQGSFPRILMLSGTIPGEPGVGGVILNDLMAELPAGTLQCLPVVTQQVVDLGWLQRAPELAGHFVRRYETGWRPVKGILGEVFGRIARIATFSRRCRDLTTQICHNQAAKSCDIVWAILDCPTVIEIATEVSRRLQKPLVVLVWDAPELLVRHLHLDRWSAGAMLKRFAAAIRASERVGVVCEQMQCSYEQQFGAGDYIVLRHGIREELWEESLSGNDRLLIGFAGSVTAVQPFQKLIQTLDDRNWLINGKPVTLRLIGARYTLDSRRAQHIEFFGWRSLKETVRLLSECSMAYLPQPFDPCLKPLAELSFPTKLTSYLAAGCRILLHAPEYASVTSFMTGYPIGRCCHSLDIADIADSLSCLDRMPQTDITTAIQAARQHEFNSHVFVKRFRRLIGGESPKPIETTTEMAGQV